ncbi:MAG: hypothetical protein CMQ20_17275 [Gammaproteobacteria bacterium]|nr:hypothetical protein [Gammaproteobacteria bacterium]
MLFSPFCEDEVGEAVGSGIDSSGVEVCCGWDEGEDFFSLLDCWGDFLLGDWLGDEGELDGGELDGGDELGSDGGCCEGGGVERWGLWHP